jgi:hypothetical protein
MQNQLKAVKEFGRQQLVQTLNCGTKFKKNP